MEYYLTSFQGWTILGRAILGRAYIRVWQFSYPAKRIAPDSDIIHGRKQYTSAELPGFTGLASLAVPAHRRITVGRYLVGLPRPLFALRRPVAERLRNHNNIGVWRRLAAMLMSARLLAGVKALFTSRLFRQC